MAPRDQFPARAAGASPRQWFPITPDNANDLPQIPQAIWVGVTGNLCVVGNDGVEATIPNVPVGYWIGSPSRVKATGTTASSLFGAV